MMQEIIVDYESKLDNLNLQGKEIVKNEDWSKVTDNLKVIYCGDNPGKTEKKEKKYFVGTAGNDLSLFVNVNNKRNGILENEYVFFNKTPFYSNKTTDINEWTDKNDIVKQSIELTIECLFKMWDKNKDLKIIIFGLNTKSFVVRTFGELILNKKYVAFFEKTTLLSHPSYNHLYSQIGKALIGKFKLEDLSTVSIDYETLINKISDTNKENWEKLKTKEKTGKSKK